MSVIDSLTGVFRLFSVRPQHPIGADGRMALSDHFRELRGRLLTSVTVMAIAMIVALFFFDELNEILLNPYQIARDQLPGDVKSELTVSGLSGGILLYLKLCGAAALIATSPVWLYQLWAFILPGLHANERKWSRVFVAIAGPLFLLGVAIGYYTLPKGIEILVNFTPEGTTNLIDNAGYVGFFIRTLLVFGIAFEIPVFVLLLNLAGVVSGKTLGAYRSWIIVGTFIFAAVATPQVDPFSMLFLAVPMVLLFGISEVIARLLDRRKAKADPVAGLGDDEQSDIGEVESIDPERD
ncbi:MAG: twin-arginine translocase subunit TatC [Nocardioides sp.]